jgi:hypothetical protein
MSFPVCTRESFTVARMPTKRGHALLQRETHGLPRSTQRWRNLSGFAVNPLFRFADFNAGQYASRNAAFQNALSVASGLPVTLDGDLLPRASNAPSGETERAANSLAGRLGLSEAAIRGDLERGDDSDFEKTALHERVFAYAEQLDKRTLPRAVVPRIDLQSPKFTRKLTTEWFARRVDERHRHCLARIVTPPDH